MRSEGLRIEHFPHGSTRHEGARIDCDRTGCTASVRAKTMDAAVRGSIREGWRMDYNGYDLCPEHFVEWRMGIGEPQASS